MLCFLLLAITITIRNKIQGKGMNINKMRAFQTLKWETRNWKLRSGGDIIISSSQEEGGFTNVSISSSMSLIIDRSNHASFMRSLAWAEEESREIVLNNSWIRIYVLFLHFTHISVIKELPCSGDICLTDTRGLLRKIKLSRFLLYSDLIWTLCRSIHVLHLQNYK